MKNSGSIAMILLAITILSGAVLAADTWTVDAIQPDDSLCVSPTFLCKTIGAAVGGVASVSECGRCAGLLCREKRPFNTV